MARKENPPPGSGPGEQQADLTVSTFSQSSRDMHVTVEKAEEAGYLCCLSMVARVPLPPEQLWDIMVDPDQCRRIFKSLKKVHHRRVLSEDGAGNRLVEVDQTGCWKFLCFRGSFTVRMIVEQRRSDRTIHFRLARSGFMKDFSGTWQIRPYDNASLDQLVNRHTPSALHRLQSGLRVVEARLGLGGGQAESLVQLQQSIAPAFAPPKAVARLMQRIAAKQITKIMTDLQDEVRRINSSSESSSTSTSSTSSGVQTGSKGGGSGGGGRQPASQLAHTGADGAGVHHQRHKKKKWRQAEAEEGEGEGDGQGQGDKRKLASHLRPLR